SALEIGVASAPRSARSMTTTRRQNVARCSRRTSGRRASLDSLSTTLAPPQAPAAARGGLATRTRPRGLPLSDEHRVSTAAYQVKRREEDPEQECRDAPHPCLVADPLCAPVTFRRVLVDPEAIQ